MFKIYCDAYWSVMLVSALLKIAADVLNLVGPLCIGALTSYVVTLSYPVDSELPPPHYVSFDDFFGNGFVLVVTMFVVLSIRACIMNAHFKLSFTLSVDVRAAIQSMVYKKALRLATFATTGGQMTMGQITNHMSADATNVMMMLQSMHFLWSAPFQIVIILIFLYFEIGFSALLGAALFVVVLPIQFKVAAIMADKQKAILRCSDKRLKLTNELLQGIKLLKMYAWEELYSKAIEVVRKEEVRNLLHINLCMITSVSITFGVPVLVTLVAFITFEPISGRPLTPDITFSSLSLFNLIAVPLFMIPVSVSAIVGSIVSSKRIIKFLLAPEVEGDRFVPMDTEGKPLSKEKKRYSDGSRAVFRKLDEVLSEPTVSIDTKTDDSDDQTGDTERALMLNGISLPRLTDASASNSDQGTAIKITDGNFAWNPESTSPALSNVNVEIPAGKLTMVIGAVGSGKSSLLAAILNEMTTLSGNVHINEKKGRVAFAAQKPWLMNASLRDNILFSSKIDKKRYRSVLDACALVPDIGILPAGDKTEIGEKGINLSGGQKQRISVARAIYADSDVVILDDPLSALDVHVGRQLFEEGVIKQLVRNNKTVILVTHQLQYLSRADLILEMKDGTIAASGSLDDIIEADPEMYEEIKQVSAAGWDNDQAESAEDERLKLKRNVSIASAEIAEGDGQLIEKEEMVRGSVSYKTYLYLLGSVGWGLILLVGVVVALQTSVSVTTNFWLSEWSEAGLSNETARTYTEYLVGYAGLSVSVAVSQALSTAMLMLSFVVAAKRLHLRMLRNIIRAPMRFFDTTLVGRILNRFSNDTQMMDYRLPETYNFFVVSIMQIIASVVVVGVVMPIFLVFVIPIAIVYYILQRYYLATSRELQRLESISKSPVFSYFSESLGGLTTIRAYRCENRFYNTILARIDRNTAAFLYVQMGARWLAVRLDALGVLFVLLSTGSTLIGALSFGINPSLVGLSSAYSLQMSNYLNYLMRNRTEVEMQMNAVERIQFFSEVDREDYSGAEPSSGWPHSGEIHIDNVSVRYAEDLEAVLRNVSVYLKSGEKVGICGRTGSGKSSLTLALLRVIDIFEGRIFIDGVNIMAVPLTTLRSKISIIPQDPVLFTGPVRTNLDPEGKVSDDEMWRALEIAQLKDVVSQLDGGLDTVVTEGGENFSVGQRQLFCLARAFLRKSRILIMDEATASVDMETDKTLQNVVATAFADRTVLTIAHRIATIRNSDKIIVLDGGRMVEFGSPEELLADECGFFTSLVGDE
ncbi:ATP-binding cassette sub-family C member 9-like [Acanthaster planci]|uniref:ATP-binding cassette sub-family C member 9-like n=1 Tax=Acanthaster planci TaxID=133434 RepID=A0A8B7ZBE2_ACAPL|nr:ATP-binding cassette sub-family C member 9-like [Acanthaster planci]